MDAILLPSQSRASLRIIIADDHEWIRNILIEVVRQTLPDADLVVTGDGQQAFDAFHTGHCDLLVSNHGMPHLDGPTLIRLVRLEAPDLPIVMVSTKSWERFDAMEAGADWFLMKAQIMEGLPPLLLQCAGGESVPKMEWMKA